MKNRYSLVSILLFCSVVVFAQYPTNRTTKTIVADVLAQMPAQQTNQYNNQLKDLVSAGEDGVLQLVNMMTPPGGDNAKIEYALSGLSHYVSAQNQESLRLTISNAYVKSLDQVNDKYIKSFVIQQIAIVGKNEAVSKLSFFLNDEFLSGFASRALVSIGGKTAEQALLAAFASLGNAVSQKDIISAIGDLKIAGVENELLPMLGSNDADLDKTVLYALSQTGTRISLPILALAAEKAGYTMNNSGASEAYLALIKRVLSQGDVKIAEKAAADLMKKAEEVKQQHTCEAALQIQIAANPDNALKLLQKALKSSDRQYRMAALNFTSDYANVITYRELLKTAKKTNLQVKIDIYNWMAQECEYADKLAMIKGLGATPFVSELNSTDLGVKKAVAEILVKIGGHDAIDALASLLKSNDSQTIAIGENMLNSASGNISSVVAPVLAIASDEGKMAGLRLLANRKSDKNADKIIEQIQNGSPAIQAVAYIALKDVVMANNLPTLYQLLESAAAQAVVPAQAAITAALKNVPQEKRLATIVSQMDKGQKDKQYLYYPILTSTGDPKSLDIISEKMTSESGQAKDGAFKAILAWNDMLVADKLFAICTDNASSNYFNPALDRYVQLVSNPAITGENRRLLLTNAIEIAKTVGQKNAVLTQLGKTKSYLGMLLAGRYLDDKPVQQAAAQAVVTIALGNKDFTGKNVEELLNKVMAVLDNPDAEYQKKAILDRLNDMPKEEGFVSIFNQKDVTGWKGLVENPISRAKMKPAELTKKQALANELARKHWSVQNGVLVFDGTGGDNLCTEKQYGDFEMYVDWKLDPNGSESDAGIYLRGTPQVQIWDIARTDVGAQVGSGGLYNNETNLRNPLKVADNKLGEWNTFYIKMVGDRVTVTLNGESVVDNTILENYWDRSQPIFATEQIELQAHGSKVYYRNIYVNELERSKPFELSSAEKNEGYRILFDGTNMHNWTGNIVDYMLQDGCISLDPKGGHGGNLYTKEEFSDFIYRFEFQLTPDANNGLGIRTPMDGDAAYVGMELQILDNEAPVYSELAPYQYHGSVYGIIPAKRGYLKPTGEWNYQEVIASGDNIKIILNGTVILDGNIREATKNGTPDKQDHPGLFNKQGHIGFLGHGSLVKFRNIRIKELTR